MSILVRGIASNQRTDTEAVSCVSQRCSAVSVESKVQCCVMTDRTQCLSTVRRYREERDAMCHIITDDQVRHLPGISGTTSSRPTVHMLHVPVTAESRGR